MIERDWPTQEDHFRVTLEKWLKLDIKATCNWGTLELAITNAQREKLSLQPLQESKM